MRMNHFLFLYWDRFNFFFLTVLAPNHLLYFYSGNRFLFGGERIFKHEPFSYFYTEDASVGPGFQRIPQDSFTRTQIPVDSIGFLQ